MRVDVVFKDSINKFFTKLIYVTELGSEYATLSFSPFQVLECTINFRVITDDEYNFEKNIR